MVRLYLAEINVGGTHNLSQCLKGIGIVPAAFVSKECREECLYWLPTSATWKRRDPGTTWLVQAWHARHRYDSTLGYSEERSALKSSRWRVLKPISSQVFIDSKCRKKSPKEENPIFLIWLDLKIEVSFPIKTWLKSIDWKDFKWEPK